MSLRARLTVAGAGAVFVALAIASQVIYFSVRSNLNEQIDASLVQSAQAVSAKWNIANSAGRLQAPSAKAKLLRAVGSQKPGAQPAPNAPAFGSNASGYWQVIPRFVSLTRGEPSSGTKSDTTPLRRSLVPSNDFVPLMALDVTVARRLAPPYFRTVRYRGVAMELYTMALGSSSGLVRTARPLTDTNATITRVRLLLIALTLGGALVAGLLGWLAANAVLRPVRALAGTVRQVSATRDLNQRIPVSGRDELASLAVDFNAMLVALDESQQAQQQLIADASHELRTPLTAHRTNIELLARPDLPADQRRRVLQAAVRTMEKLSTLVDDLIRAARAGVSVDTREPLALDELVAAAVERARHRAPELSFDTRLASCQVVGAGSRLERAIDNVLDNAVKWSPSGGRVDISLLDGRLTIRDHGPGIAHDDLPHVFDRFYRAAAARALPGSGLGLAIVKQAIDDHGGSVTVANADGGGTLVTLWFAANGHA